MTCYVHEYRLSHLLCSLECIIKVEVSLKAERKVKSIF
jgi:hypothetical protein